MSFYQRLQNLAKDKGISFREIEENLDYPKNTLYSYKTKDPSGKRLVELSRYFGVSTDYLLGEDSVQRVIKTETHLSGKESKAIHANVLFENLAQANSVVLYAMLNEKNKEKVTNYISDLTLTEDIERLADYKIDEQDMKFADIGTISFFKYEEK
ncbi:helix-turn-helix domain-containing protein [Lactococcus lactis]|uniref:XRE family transcriptional regulator n=1 Tax=Lactococcus lactis TaxID=1358 RepID=A0A3S4MEU3_9LACT|nr:helix-turn-helix transcriptional regulator [Lactococcus lactis]KST94811.1 Transcriptional regulator xre family [Lactococcus lactis subsp. lactis]MCT0055775.1 XRE family transcriptional regulator [Lactococcus lactis subsp. lactis]NYZ58005.1 helix-turn-helix transcriptional regulator [Lactococcus lactis]RWR49680.1 XRE family transcriptional regulator [Lactococcus lactis]